MEASVNHKHDGAGLGLAIAKFAVETSNGKLILSNETNNICTFTIIFPYHKPQEGELS
jgi:signal transduction histidine kinase